MLNSNWNWINEIKELEIYSPKSIDKKYSQSNKREYIEHIIQHIPTVNWDYDKNFKDIEIVELLSSDGYHLSNKNYFIDKGFNSLLIDGNNHKKAEFKEHFITKENVLNIFKKYNTPSVFDMLCIDLYGNDIYILQEILLEYKPSLIVAEYNPIFDFGDSKAITYNPNHIWNNDDYYGFSFSAGLKLAKANNYTCIFQKDNNMYLVKNSILAESLQVYFNNFCLKESELPNYLIKVKYNKSNCYRISTKKTWVKY